MVASTTLQPTVLEIIKSKRRTVSAEIIPPRNGAETGQILRQIEKLKEVPVDFISVTKGAGGSLRGGTLPIAQLVKSRFDLTAIAHFTCRDYTIEEIENNLVDHHYFGIHNILALRGDPPDGQPDHFVPSPNRHMYAHQLVSQIRALNRGEYLSRKGFDQTGVRKGQATDFCIGVAAYPEHEPFEQGIEFFKQKVDAGAQFAITQMLFDAEPYKRFIDACEKANAHVPTLPGLRILTQKSTAERMIKKFGIKIPQTLVDAIDHAERTGGKEAARKAGLEAAIRLSEELLSAGAPGIHVFVMNDEVSAAELLKTIR